MPWHDIALPWLRWHEPEPADSLFVAYSHNNYGVESTVLSPQRTNRPPSCSPQSPSSPNPLSLPAFLHFPFPNILIDFPLAIGHKMEAKSLPGSAISLCPQWPSLSRSDAMIMRLKYCRFGAPDISPRTYPASNLLPWESQRSWLVRKVKQRHCRIDT